MLRAFITQMSVWPARPVVLEEVRGQRRGRRLGWWEAVLPAGARRRDVCMNPCRRGRGRDEQPLVDPRVMLRTVLHIFPGAERSLDDQDKDKPQKLMRPKKLNFLPSKAENEILKLLPEELTE